MQDFCSRGIFKCIVVILIYGDNYSQATYLLVAYSLNLVDTGLE